MKDIAISKELHEILYAIAEDRDMCFDHIIKECIDECYEYVEVE